MYLSGSMSDGMPMPGGWTMSMAWMRMPGQTWPAASASFMGMWVLMMVAMMMPSLVPMLSSYRRALGEADGVGRRTAIAGAGYFAVWTFAGVCAYPLGLGAGAAAMRWPAVARLVPLATGAVLVLAGAVQLTAWKARHLRCCRDGPDCDAAPSAWRYGLRLGVHCSLCCSGLMAVLLAVGVMDVGAMAVIAAAITAERYAARPERVARPTGAAVVVAGALLVARAMLGA
jgi:predicted metal-binding membrane protein